MSRGDQRKESFHGLLNQLNKFENTYNLNLTKLDKKQTFKTSKQTIVNRLEQSVHLSRYSDGDSLTLESFECNQSFPCVRKTARYEVKLGTPLGFLKMDKIRVDGPNGLRFSGNRTRGLFTPEGSTPCSATTEPLLRLPKSDINPNKAVFTIDSKSSKILIVNHKACQMLGYSPKELCDMLFSNLLANKNKRYHVSALAEGQLNSEDGTMVLLSGKVVEMCSKSGDKIAVSLWVRQIDVDGRCLAVAEPVQRRVSQLIIDSKGSIITGDHETLILFQLENLEMLLGMDIKSLIPAIQIPDKDCEIISKCIKKQRATGRTTDGISFPLCLQIIHHDHIESQESADSGVSNSGHNLYCLTIWVYQNISGLIVVDSNGVIESCNHHFSMLMFGIPQTEVISRPINNLIPNFGLDMEYLGRTCSQSSMENESETETDPVEQISELSHSVPMDKSGCYINYGSNLYDTTGNELNIEIELSNTMANNSIGEPKNSTEHFRYSKNVIRSELFDGCAEPIPSDLVELKTPVNENTPVSYPTMSSINSLEPNGTQYKSDEISTGMKSVESAPLLPSHMVTSTPDVRRLSCSLLPKFGDKPIKNQPIDQEFNEGRYKGTAIHNDGGNIDVLYTISCQSLPCGRRVYCVWLSRDPETNDADDEEAVKQNLTLTFNSVSSTAEQKTPIQTSSRPNSVSLLSQCDDDSHIQGEYSKYYTTLKQIGKGAFGYVKMAYRNTDRMLVITKFILKEKLNPNLMVIDTNSALKEIPMEVFLLQTVNHPNIVTVLDVFENEKFYQLVMEKHGSGMDLFEFIDRRPMIDEQLGSFIFRQIADAINYLHSLDILHRDIKDENIIIDQNFHIKLIDFGSATVMEAGKLFSTFYGTTEYCSPEVLAGNKYAGPELEMWSLGVTLYVLIFFENPFTDIEETLHSDLGMPHTISELLESLLFSMLDKDPRTRCRMHELMVHPWVNQEVDKSQFNFAALVPCEKHELLPDKYYKQRVYSSNSALSTTSQDSLSLADDESILEENINATEEPSEFGDGEETTHNSENGLSQSSATSLSYHRNETSGISNTFKLIADEPSFVNEGNQRVIGLEGSNKSFSVLSVKVNQTLEDIDDNDDDDDEEEDDDGEDGEEEIFSDDSWCEDDDDEPVDSQKL